MPAIETLTLQDTGEDIPGPTLGSMPLLRTLSFRSSDLPDIGIPWNQITTISVVETPAGLVNTILKRCIRLERLYVQLDDSSLGPVDPVLLADLRHLTICHDFENFPWSSLTTPGLESFALADNYLCLPQSDEIRQFFERCSNLHLFQIRPSILGNAEPFFEMFSSTTVRTLQLEVFMFSRDIQPLLSFLTLQQLKKQLPALQQVHVDITELEYPSRDDRVESTGDVIIHTLLALNTDIEQHPPIYGAPSSLQMIHLHTTSFHDNLLSVMNSGASHLRVTSIPLKLNSQGQFHFPIGHLFDL
ncbi:hypothetical protein DL96DRAFT_375643 [Flagelloscypha sp. PMI_526]|nr:hypothetical protein DL96DRAFT_375643 [Flagelloscypha sp. PMI_526]